MVFDQYDKQRSADDIHFKIPEGWRIERLYDVAKIITSTVDKKSVGGQNPVKLCNYQDVYYNNKITSNINFMTSTASNNEIDKFTLKKGDVVFTKDSEDPFDIGIPSYIDDEIEDLVCGYHLTIIKSFKHELLGEYAYYVLKSELSKHQFALASKGVTRFGLTYQGTKNIRICIPSISEQKKIVNFLDQKITTIDQLIEKKKQLIEKLNEKRIAVITQAVSKGLDPSTPMKDSGVDWLGKVPTHWRKRRLRFLLKDKFVNGIFKKALHWGSGTRIINVSDLYIHDDFIYEDGLDRLDCTENEVDKFSAIHGDFFLVRSSLKLEGVGKSATLLKPKENIVFECHVVRGRPNLNVIEPRFLNYYLNSKFARDFFISRANIVTMATIDQDKFKELMVILPAYEEQVSIVKHINECLDKIDSLMNAVEKAIQKIIEYRTALITAAVTGKIDVRDIPIPDQEAMACGD